MYVRVINFNCHSSIQRSEITDMYREIIHQAHQVDGFVGSTLLLNQENARAMTLMYWRDQDAASAAAPFVLHRLTERLHEIVDEAPEVVGYEVVEERGFSTETR